MMMAELVQILGSPAASSPGHTRLRPQPFALELQGVSRCGWTRFLLLGDLSRVAARTITAFIRATVGERDLSVGVG